MTCIRYCFLAMVTITIAMAGSLASANQLANPGFEDPITADGPPFVGFWESFSGDGDQDNPPDIARNDSTMPRSGAQALELGILSTDNTFAGVFQDVPLAPGIVPTLSGWHKSLADDGAIEIRFEYRDSVADVEINRTGNFTPSPGAAYEPFTFSDPAGVPAGANSVRIVYAVQTFGPATNVSVFVDDLSFVPEPTSMALLSLAGVAFAGRRRR